MSPPAAPTPSNNPLMVAHGHMQAGRLDEAEKLVQRVLERQPRSADAHHLMAMVLMRRNDAVRAVRSAEQAALTAPANAQIRNTLGVALSAAGSIQKAIEQFGEAVRLKPDWPAPWNNLANVLMEARRLEEAAAAMEQLLRLTPDDLHVLKNYAVVLFKGGRPELGLALHQRGARLYPADPYFIRNAAFLSNYVDVADPMERVEAHKRLARMISSSPPAAPARPRGEPLDPDRPLRIGLLSGDLRTHSVASFLAPILDHHDRARYAMVCFYNYARSDVVTERFRAAADGWREVAGLDDGALAAAVREERIDVLIDLAGYTDYTRVEVMRLAPAPVQATYLGYPNTTGIDAVDWRLVDSITDPPGSERFATERLWRLDPCFLCYRPLADAPDLAQPPCVRTGAVTFGMFNATVKITPRMAEVWCRILNRLPGSRLVIKAAWEDGAWVRKLLLSLFESHGVSLDRIVRVPYASTQREYQELYNEVDVALDPNPYNGTTTTCEALWMGVPVVSMRGQTHASRVGASLLRCVGLEELVADDAEGYIRLAAGLAADLPRRTELRRTLRDRMAASPLRDETGFARRFESALRGMWTEHCRAAR